MDNAQIARTLSWALGEVRRKYSQGANCFDEVPEDDGGVLEGIEAAQGFVDRLRDRSRDCESITAQEIYFGVAIRVNEKTGATNVIVEVEEVVKGGVVWITLLDKDYKSTYVAMEQARLAIGRYQKKGKK